MPQIVVLKQNTEWQMFPDWLGDIYAHIYKARWFEVFQDALDAFESSVALEEHHMVCMIVNRAHAKPRHVGGNSHGVFGREAVTASFFLFHSDASLPFYCGTFQPQDVLHIKRHFMSLTSMWKESLSVMTSLDTTLIYQLPPIGSNREPVEIISALLCLKESGRIWNDVGWYVFRKTLVLIWRHMQCMTGFHLL